MEPDEKAIASRNAAAFKLATLETCAADPLTKPIDLALLVAYLRYMKWPTRVAYMPNLKARVLTATKSEETISISRARLVRHGYLKKVVDKLNGSTTYEINNPRADVVADHVTIAEETLKEWDAQRKARSRARPRKIRGTASIPAEAETSNVPRKIRGAEPQCPTENLGDTSRIFRDNSLDEYLGDIAPKEKPSAAHNSYAVMSRGY